MTDAPPSQRVLYVDDPSMMDRPATTLRSELSNADVDTASGMEAALSRLAETAVDCVVAAHALPESTGIDLLERVRETYSNLPFVLVTRDGNERIASAAVAASVTAYVPLPDEGYDPLVEHVAGVLTDDGAASGGEGAVATETDADGTNGTADRERRSRDWLMSLFESLPNPVVHAEIDDEGPLVLDVNPAFEETFGYDRSELIGENLDDYIVPPGEEDIATEINEDIQSGNPIGTFIVDRQTTDGIRTFQFDSGIRVDNGPTGEGFGIYTDITDLKERERELERQRKRLDEFASVVSHDLRNPLKVAVGHLDLAREECDSDHLDIVDDALDRMEELIDDVLTLAREGEQVSETEPVALGDAVEAAWQNVDTADASLSVETDLTIRADESRLRRLFANLARNAIKHGDESVTVTVGSLDDADGFYVADDGLGIPQDERERVFESGYSTADDGTGFGLAIVSEIAEAHNWSVSVTDSESDGARFEIAGIDVEPQ